MQVYIVSFRLCVTCCALTAEACMFVLLCNCLASACPHRPSLIYLLLSGKYNYLFSFHAVNHPTESNQFFSRFSPPKMVDVVLGNGSRRSLSAFLPVWCVSSPSQSSWSPRQAESIGLWDSSDLTCPSRLIQPVAHAAAQPAGPTVSAQRR